MNIGPERSSVMIFNESLYPSDDTKYQSTSAEEPACGSELNVPVINSNPYLINRHGPVIHIDD